MNVSWNDILLILRRHLPEGVCKVWLEPLAGEIASCAPASSDTAPTAETAPWELRLTAPNGFVADWVREHLSRPILQAACEVMGAVPLLVVQAAPPARPDGKPALPRPLSPEALARSLPTAPGVLAASTQLTLPMPLAGSPLRTDFLPTSREWKHSFEDFVVGPCNQLAHAAACNMLQSSAPVGMLFLCSSPGLGKTHLVQAVGRALCLEAGKASVRLAYLTAEEFTSRFVRASQYGGMHQFKEFFRNLDMLLLEDVHFLRGKEKTQEELLATIKSLHTDGGRVVLTSSFAPRDLSGVDSQLVSRFCSGFVAAIDRPGKDTRFHILMDKARREAFLLPEKVAEILAERITSDVRMLESCLHNLALKSSTLGSPVTEEMALEVIRNVARNNAGLDLESVLDLVCRGFDLTPAQLASRSRRQDFVVARNTAFFLLRKHTALTLEEIGNLFNRRHSTVLKGITSVEREISRQTPLGRQISHTLRRIERNAATA